MKGKYADQSLIVVKRIGISLAIALAVTMGVIALTAMLVLNQTLPDNGVSYGAWAALASGSIIGSLTAIWGMKDKAILLSAIFGAGYLLLLLCGNMLFFQGGLEGFGVTAFLIMGISLAVGAISFVRKEQSNRHKFRYKNRSIV